MQAGRRGFGLGDTMVCKSRGVRTDSEDRYDLVGWWYACNARRLVGAIGMRDDVDRQTDFWKESLEIESGRIDLNIINTIGKEGTTRLQAPVTRLLYNALYTTKGMAS